MKQSQKRQVPNQGKKQRTQITKGNNFHLSIKRETIKVSWLQLKNGEHLVMGFPVPWDA